MYTPMLGGAETYLKDLLWSVDRRRFEPIFFYESWTDFEEFLELDRCPALKLHAVNVIEPGGHTHVNRRIEPRPSREPKNGSAFLKSKLRRLYKSTSLGPLAAAQGLKWLNYSLWRTNKSRLIAAFKAEPVDVLHIVNGGYPGATTARIAAIAAKELNIPCAMTICSTPFATNFSRALEGRIDRSVFQSVDRFVIPAELPGQALVERRKFDAESFTKIYFGVRAPKLNGDELNRRQSARKRLGVADDALLVGTVSSFAAVKGQSYLIDALALLKPKFPKLRAVLIGDGPTRPEVQKRAIAKDVADISTFTGFFDDVFAAVNAFDLFVLPSDLEGVPYVVLEAMSQAKPIVATRVGGVPEAIISGETGLLVPPKDPQALAAAIETLINDENLAARLGRNAYLRFKEHFTVERMVERHEMLYKDLANKSVNQR